MGPIQPLGRAGGVFAALASVCVALARVADRPGTGSAEFSRAAAMVEGKVGQEHHQQKESLLSDLADEGLFRRLLYEKGKPLESVRKVHEG